MNNRELLDIWPPRPPDTPRADPLSMLFDGVPDPVILSDNEELPLQRTPLMQLMVRLLGWLILVPVLIFLAYRLFKLLKIVY